MKRKRFVVVGAGLGGCVAAATLADAGHAVTVVAHADGAKGPVDKGRPAITEPHVGLGLGGTTRFWHNGLRLPEAEAWEAWPLDKAALEADLAWARDLLGGSATHDAAAEALREAWRTRVDGSVRLEDGLFYPDGRRNLWKTLHLDGRVTVLRGEVLPLPSTKTVEAVDVRVGAEVVRVPCNGMILAAGGLGTPLLLANLTNPWVGKGYEDHPTGLVAEMEVDFGGLEKLWNVRVDGGTLRQPLVVGTACGPMAWYVRPAPPVGYGVRRARLGTLLSDVRNYPWRVGNYVRLALSAGDLMEVLSLKLGWHVPTRRFGLWLVGGCPPSRHMAVGKDANGTWWRDWRLPDGYEACVRESLGAVVVAFGGHAGHVREVEGWWDGLQSSSHHSGTCRMAANHKEGVVDARGKIFGTANVWVADGSVIPASGTANTGWLIAALARYISKDAGAA